VAAVRNTSDAVAVRERSPVLDAYLVVLAAFITTWSSDLVWSCPIWLREWLFSEGAALSDERKI
jgi:hypothetical protein